MPNSPLGFQVIIEQSSRAVWTKARGILVLWKNWLNQSGNFKLLRILSFLEFRYSWNSKLLGNQLANINWRLLEFQEAQTSEYLGNLSFLEIQVSRNSEVLGIPRFSEFRISRNSRFEIWRSLEFGASRKSLHAESSFTLAVWTTRMTMQTIFLQSHWHLLIKSDSKMRPEVSLLAKKI